MKILFLAANPIGTNELQLDKEAKEIEEGLQRSKLRDQFTLVTKWAVDAETLRRAMLKEQPDVVHFSGHGEGQAGLVLLGQDGKPKPATAEALAGLFEIFRNVKCVLLNACYAEVQAQGIIKHIDYVVGMKRAVRDDAAIAFATGFYDGLGYGLTIEDAFKLGCNAIQFEVASFSSTTRKAISVDFENAQETLVPLAEHLIPTLLRKERLDGPTTASVASVQTESLAEKLRATNDTDKPEAIQQYRERVREFLADRELTPIEEFQLATLAQVLGLSKERVNQILKEEQNRIEQARENYRQVLIQTIQRGYDPFIEEIKRELKTLQENLGLTDLEADDISSSVLLTYAGPDKVSPARSGFKSSTMQEQPQAFQKAPEPSVPTRHRFTQLLVGSSIACLILAGGLYGYRHWQGNQPEQNTLQQAVALAKQGQWEAAIATLNQIPANSPAAAQSSAYLEVWSIRLLKRAEEYYKKGDVDAALRDTQSIPKNSSIYTQAQTEIVTWNKDKQTLDKIKQNLDTACDRAGGKRLLKLLESPGLKKQADDLIEENEKKCPSQPIEPPVVETSSPPPQPPVETSSPPIQSPTLDYAPLKQEEVEPVFREFIAAWNSGQYKKQLDLMSKEDFTSLSYEIWAQTPYAKEDYSSYAKLRKEIISKYGSIKVEVSNEKFIPISNDEMLVQYNQHYSRSGYESWGVNKVYFRKKSGKIEIYKEAFYREKVKA